MKQDIDLQKLQKRVVLKDIFLIQLVQFTALIKKVFEKSNINPLSCYAKAVQKQRKNLFT